MPESDQPNGPTSDDGVAGPADGIDQPTTYLGGADAPGDRGTDAGEDATQVVNPDKTQIINPQDALRGAPPEAPTQVVRPPGVPGQSSAPHYGQPASFGQAGPGQPGPAGQQPYIPPTQPGQPQPPTGQFGGQPQQSAGQSQPDQPQFGPPQQPYGQPQFGQPQFGPPPQQFGPPPQQFGQPGFGAAGPQQFGAPGIGNPPTKSGSGKTIAIIVTVLVLVIALAVGLAIVFWPDGDDEDGAGPATTVHLKARSVDDELDVTARAPKGWKVQETPGDASGFALVPESETHSNEELVDLLSDLRRGRSVGDITSVEAVSVSIRDCSNYGAKFEGKPTPGAGWQKSKEPIEDNEGGFDIRQDAAVYAQTTNTCLLVVGYAVAKSGTQLPSKPREVVDAIAEGKYLTDIKES
ncbi:hypothetical protein QSJ18_10800 [Gordonia sp. ABSL1-1]|uniref:hypothetical protein n=1 Tax=Gordonia sp. ABSL1-1 TaxID=3053923 RepID=UPI0025741550|nr:hypothetical protein [Gordonia sp. ABSL1-1]MDL9937232.1 hypothetical protein [Gordonia sp. ABSL1-1]